MVLIVVRWHGRGGQGAWTASELLAKAAIHEGKYIQSFPEFGPERMGAPVRAFTRISDKPIRLHCSVYSPDIVVVLDPTLMATVPFAIFNFSFILAGSSPVFTTIVPFCFRPSATGTVAIKVESKTTTMSGL